MFVLMTVNLSSCIGQCPHEEELGSQVVAKERYSTRHPGLFFYFFIFLFIQVYCPYATV
jgi:hypothetical protein